jgi:hypothetical protein
VSAIINGNPKRNVEVRRFGYLLSTLFIILTLIAMLAESALLPWSFLLLMYFLTGSMWVPGLIKPFYNLFGKYIIPMSAQDSNPDQTKSESD